ncbi:MAG TPA: hypothetical protein PKA10_07660 [Selenomonadales bacterium]|nr:hypothetical protein [Selenomonadales bacterium]
MGKSVGSYKLPYGKPRAEREAAPTSPKTPERIDPVAYIRCWIKYNLGMPVDITKAKLMTKADLKKTDPRGIELMLAYGVTQKEIAQQYNTPLGSIALIFKRLGVNTKVPSAIAAQPTAPAQEVAATVPAADEPAPAPPAALPDPASEIIWFDQSTRAASIANTGIVVRKNGRIEISAAINGKILVGTVDIGISRDGRTLKLVRNRNGSGLKIFRPSGSNSARGALSLAGLVRELQGAKIALPARYVGDWDESDTWTGTLQ